MENKNFKIEVPLDFLLHWQEIVDILADVVDIPAALIMRYSEPYIEVFVSSERKGNPYKPGDKEHFEGSGLYCETVIKTQQKLLIPSALEDPKWRNNPDIKLGMISYLGYPILLPDKKPFGTLCVLDEKTNEFSQNFEKLMLKFRNLIESNLEMIYMNQILGDKNRRLIDYLFEIQALRGLVPICSHCKSIRDEEQNWHEIEEYILKNPVAEFSHSICPKCMKKYYQDIK